MKCSYNTEVTSTSYMYTTGLLSIGHLGTISLG